jgi:hypothetical protein
LRVILDPNDLDYAASRNTLDDVANAIVGSLALAGYWGEPSPRYHVIATEHHGNVIVHAMDGAQARAKLVALGVPESEILRDAGISSVVPPRLAVPERATPLTWGFELDQDETMRVPDPDEIPTPDQIHDYVETGKVRAK